MFKNFRPLADRILIKRLEDESTTEGGIIIPDTAKEKVQTASVIAVGPGRVVSHGKTVPMSVKIGDTVYFGKYSGTEVDEDHVVLREEEILGVIEK